MASRGLTFQFDEQAFLEDVWQRRPLLIKNALPNWRSPLTADELAGLSLEMGVDSRLIGHHDGIWELNTGPFDSSHFNRSDAWTLLVNGVEQWVPEVAALKDCLRFLPHWRFDDVMVSYAVEGGGVGPHFDRYDVFLLQGSGTRLWRLGEWCDESTPRIDHDGLALLDRFQTSEEYELQPGDVLYVPPGLAHWGIAQSDCLTYSLGFRAPRVADLTARWIDKALERMDPDLLLEDRLSVLRQPRAGEITADHVKNARQAVLNALQALDDGDWLGEVVTESGDHAEPLSPLAKRVCLYPGARLAWESVGENCRVFANGEQCLTRHTLLPTLQKLCCGETLDYADLQQADVDLCAFLTANGVLVGT